MSDELPEDVPLAPDADTARRLALAQEEINNLNQIVSDQNDLVRTIHRDLHEAANLMGDIHKAGALNTVKNRKYHERLAAMVEKHGHPQDAPETDPVTVIESE